METVRFEELDLRPEILRAVVEMGFEEATPIQAKAIPVIMAGDDIVGQAQTGTGKTAAFGIPILSKIDPKLKKTQALILCPTRELAIQVAEEIRKLSKFLHGIKVLPIYGGQEITKQIRSLKGGIQIIVGTPGRVMDHMRRKTIRLDHIKMVALDEADEMLNMGFRDEIESILSEISEEKQTILFSATMPQAIMDITKNYQKNAKVVKVVRKELTVANIDQYYYEVRPKNKLEVLCRLLDMHNPRLSVIFCNTKRQVDELVSSLQGRGYFADGIHGDLKQQQRDRVMGSFRTGKIEILVATDVAARGIDVDDVDAVFNYDIPQDEEYYVHRIGRTGRAGRVGKAFSFVVGKEVYKLKDIQRYCKTKIKAKPIPSIDDVMATKLDKIFEDLDEYIKSVNLNDYIDLVNEYVDEKDYTALELAAAFVKMKMEENLGTDSFDMDRELDDAEQTGATEPGMVRLFINIGKNHKASPKDILGAIAGESGIPGKLVGTIDMFDKYTFVEVPREVAKDVLHGMKNVKIKGKNIHVEIANKK